MVAYLDVDCFLSKDDMQKLEELEWPWKIRHFILSKKCYGCGCSTDSRLRAHFIIDKSNIKNIINIKQFWCQVCDYMLVYDHYSADECDYCYTI